jgi:hypothetical protein
MIPESPTPQPPPRYYLALDGQLSGPHGLDALKDMASVHAFTRDTLATPEGTENWLPLHAIPALADTLFPSAAKFQLKEKAFAPTSDSDRPVTVEELLHTNLASESRQPPAAHAPCPGTSRRRDFLFAAICANALALIAWLLLPSHPFILVPLLAYVVIINLGLYWVFYQVMSRY